MKTLLYILLTLAIGFPLTSFAAGGELFLSPNSGIYAVGKPFEVQVLANTGGQTVNAVEAELSYNPRDLAVDHISIDNSILTEWSTPAANDGGTGIITFSGWAGSNYNGASGLLVTVYFKPLRTTQTTLTFNSGAMLSAESRGSNIITAMKGAAFGTMPAQVAAPEPTIPVATSSEGSVPTTETTSPDAGVNQGAALPLAGSSTPEAAALMQSGFDFVWYYAAFFGALALVAFFIAYYFHRKKIAF